MNDLKKLFPGMNEPKIAIRLLERAKLRIRGYQNPMVCGAIRKSAQTFGEKMMADILLKHISECLGGDERTVGGWLWLEHRLNIRDYGKGEEGYNLVDAPRKYREAWIDSMIEQLR